MPSTYGVALQEPHPADDLNGADVARKLTIVSRFIPSLRSALPNGYQSVSTKSLVPAELEGIDSGDEFIKRLPEFDAHFDKMRADAAAEGKVLRFAGVVDVQAGIIKADLEKYVVLVRYTWNDVSRLHTGTPSRTPSRPRSEAPTTSSCSTPSGTVLGR